MIADSKYYPRIDASSSYVIRHDRMTPDEEFLVHSHPFWELAYVVRGSGRFIVGAMSQPFSRGEIVLIPPDMRHGWIFDNTDRDAQNRVEDICFSFLPELMHHLAAAMPEYRPLKTLDAYRQTALRLCDTDLTEMKQLLGAAAAAPSDDQYLAVLRILHRLANLKNRCPTGLNVPVRRASEKMQRIEAFVSLHYNREVSIDEMAALVHMSRSSFCVFFKRESGGTFFSFLNDYRIAAACRLLATTDRPIAEVAYNVGFGNAAHFSRTFRKLKNTSPAAYRKACPAEKT